jgi:ADP-ribose pyrophosphatase
MPSYRKSTIPPQAKRVFNGIIFDVYQWEQEMFDGSKATFEKLSRPDTADVIAVTKDKRIVLTHQQQPGSEIFYSTPGGRIDADEDPLVSAKRELLEETGYGGGTWELYMSFTPFQKIDWVLYTYIARDVSTIGEMNHEAGEKIDVVLVSIDEFMTIMASEECRDDHLALHLLRLQKDPTKFNAFRKLLSV